MKLLLLILLGLLFFLVLAGFYLLRRLERWAASSEVRRLGKSFDGGLAIPMRDCDTRRRAPREP